MSGRPRGLIGTPDLGWPLRDNNLFFLFSFVMRSPSALTAALGPSPPIRGGIIDPYASAFQGMAAGTPNPLSGGAPDPP
eukprot:14502870-Alexandrium_andersonii.AAC.1